MKDVSQLVPDIRAALGKATEYVAHDVTMELKDEGPYWSGQFEAAWEVNVGDKGIPASLKDQVVQDGDDFYIRGVLIEGGRQKQITPVFVPKPDKLNGYTIGNLMEYRETAMDINGQRRKYPTSAREDWFTTYMQGGQVKVTIGLATSKAMKEAGFR